MKMPNSTWKDDWKIGANRRIELELGKDIVSIFELFWNYYKLDTKSKSTKNRYLSALHALGGYIVEKGVLEHTNLSAQELINKYIDQDGGPLIHYDNESWQNELDMVCKKLFKFMNR